MITSDEKDDIYEGSVTFKNKKQEKGHLLLDFKDNGNFDIYIVDTDYDNCAVGYVCGETGGNNLSIYVIKISNQIMNSLKKFY